MFDADANPTTGEFVANSSTVGNQGYPAVARRNDGQFVVLWADTQDGGSSWNIFGQNFDQTGAAIGTQFPIATTTELYTAVAADGRGDYVVDWTSYGEDGSARGIFAQLYFETQDDAAPIVSDVRGDGTRLDAETRQTLHPVSAIVVDFSENLDTAGGAGGVNSVLNPANWALSHEGVDISEQIAGISFGLEPASGKYQAALALADSLGDGSYTLVARHAIRDLAGNALDGDVDAVAGGDFRRDFRILRPVVDGGPLAVDTPARGAISDGESDAWTFAATAGQSFRVVANPGELSGPSPLPPMLQFVDVRVYDPSNTLVAHGTSSGAGEAVVLPSITPALDGTYRVVVQVDPAHAAERGNYLLSVWNSTPDVHPLVFNQNATGIVPHPYAVDRWTFAAQAGQQIRFDWINTSASSIDFTLTGPGGTTVFSNRTADSDPVNLTATGNYFLDAVAQGATGGSYAFRINLTSQIDLTLGTPASRTLIGTGDGQLFRVGIADGNPLRVALDDAAADDRVEVYIKQGAPPTRQDFDIRSSDIGADHQVLVPFAAPGDWYILVYAENVAQPTSFTIQADSIPLDVTAVGPSHLTTGESATITIQGAGFVPGTQAELVAADNSTVIATSSTVWSFDRMTATFDLTGVTAGQYGVRVTSPTGPSRTLPEAIEVALPGQARLETRLILPAAMGRHQPATLYVEYANTGTASMSAPILLLHSTDPDGSDHPKWTLDKNLLAENLWTSGLPQGYSEVIQIYASGATPGILEPGETIRVPVYYGGMLKPWDTSDTAIELGLDVHLPDSTEVIDWQSVNKPAWLDDDAWHAVSANLAAQFGPTWGDYVRTLSADASYLGQFGESVRDVGQLFGFELQKAVGLSPVGSLATAVDAQVPTAGLSLQFDRAFGNTITSRYRSGPFGRGWDASWQYSLEQLADGTLVVHESSDSLRYFTPDSRTPGAYFSQTGDTGRMRAVAGGFELTETSGLKTRYQADGKLEYIQDINGNRITAGYTSDRLTSLTSSSGGSISIAYNAAGLISQVTDSAGRTTLYAYDPSNTLLLSVTGPRGTTSYTYSTGNGIGCDYALLSETSPDGLTRHYEYDARGRLIASFLEANVQRVDFTYDAVGEVTSTDAAGVASHAFFDHRGLVVRTEDALGHYVVYNYNSARQLIETTDDLGRTTTYTRCDCGRPKTITDVYGRTILTFTLGGPNNAPTAFTDANGNTTRYGYDAAGNIVSTTYADGTIETATYDGDGNLDIFTNRRGQLIDRTVNSAGQVTHEEWSDGTSRDYTYDSHGRLHTATDAQGTTTLTYDGADRLTRVDYPNGRWIAYTYDAAGRRTRIEDNSGFATQYFYDSAGRLDHLLDASDALIAQYAYDAAGRLVREDKGNGTYTVYGYDAGGRQTSISNYAPDGSVNSKFLYTYDAAGRRSTETAIDGMWIYTYDLTDQLIHAVFASTNPSIADQDLSYEYDALGNRTRTVVNGAATSYTANNMNQYTTAGATEFMYDSDGNLIQENGPDGLKQYTYDEISRLVRVQTLQGVWQYEYDVLGNRTAVIHDGQRTE